MSKILILQGLPGSGKSHFAKQKVRDSNGAYVRINKDDLRAMLHDSAFSSDNERVVVAVRDTLIQNLLRKGKNLLIDDTNLHPKHIRKIRALAGSQHEVEVMFFNTDIEVCIARDAKREGKAHVGEKVIRGMAKDWEKWKHEDTSIALPKQEVIDYVPGAPFIVMSDLDGTLAHMNGKRSPYEWKRCIEDDLDAIVRDVLIKYHPTTPVIIMSGRDEECRPETEEWLIKNSVPFDELFMRAEGDNRKDSIVKRELFDAHIRGKYNVLFVLDDRNQVVDEWRLMGLKCFQVAEGAF